MATTEEQPKEIKEYKDFTSVTNIRKFTQEAMSPVIRSLQQQLSAMMDDHKELTKKVSKMEDIFRAQSIIEQRIQDGNRIVRDFKDQIAFKRREDERKFTKIDAANEKLILEIHSLKASIQNQDEIIKQMAQRNTKSHEMYGSLTTNTDRAIKEMQSKYTEFTRQVLDLTKMMKHQYQKNQSQMQVIREMFKTQRAALEQKTKPLALFMSEREIIRQQYDELFTKIINSVTKQDFQAYRKSQKLALDDQLKQIKNDIDETLPQSLREILPSVQLKLKEVEKIKVIQKNCKQLQLGIQNTVKKIAQTSEVIVVKIEQIAKESEIKTTNIQTEMQTKIQELQQKQVEMAQKIQQRIQQMKMEIHEQVSSIIEKQTSQIHKTIQAQVSNNKNLNRNNELHSSARDQAFRKQIQQVKSIKDKMLSRYNRIQELGQSIDSKIQGYSNKITRIKSDYQLFADNIRKQVSGVIKFRDTFLDRLQDVGKLLSSYTETLLIMTSVLIQNSQEQSLIRSGKQPIQPIVFVTDNDGIIFEWKPQNQRGWIQYRRQKMQIKQFLKSFMYSLITFVDDQFTNLSFLNWKDQKPSVFFRQRVFSNYCISRKRIIENASKQKVFHRRSPCYSSTQTCQNQNICLVQQDQPVVDPCSSTKQFSRTIDSKIKLNGVLEQGNLILTNQQIPKNYSIKRSKPLSGRAASKQKTVSNDLSRYDQVFLTSRSACRSRISQLV